MGIFDIFKRKTETKTEIAPAQERPQPSAAMLSSGYPRGQVYAIYDGETTMGGIGPIKNYVKDHYALRARARQLYLESPLCHMVINRLVDWVIGSGLRLEAEPQESVLQAEGIKLDTEAFNRSVESLWAVCASTSMFDLAGCDTLPKLMSTALREGKLGGDVLVLLHVLDGIVKIRHIDGAFVANPPECTIQYSKDGSGNYDYVFNATGNRIRNGVEIDEYDRHIAYHVNTGLTSVRVEAKDTQGFVRAFLYYGSKPAAGEMRGTTTLAPVLEPVKTLDRYIRATAESAEERAKHVIFFEHDQYSVESDPLVGIRARATVAQPSAANLAAAAIPVDAQAKVIADDVAVSMNRQVTSLPRGVKAHALGSDTENNVPEFAEFHIDIICAAMNMPPDVAMGKYNDSFSASRMAGKTWEHTFMAERVDFTAQYLSHVYSLQVYLWVAQGRIKAPGYLAAVNRNPIAMAAYTHSRWVGDMFPDIDPLKTVKYVREMLGKSFEHMPLGTPERAAEILDNGDYDSILKQSGESLKTAESNGMKPEPKTEPGAAQTSAPPPDTPSEDTTS